MSKFSRFVFSFMAVVPGEEELMLQTNTALMTGMQCLRLGTVHTTQSFYMYLNFKKRSNFENH